MSPLLRLPHTRLLFIPPLLLTLLMAIVLPTPGHAAGITVAPVAGEITPVTADYLKKSLHVTGAAVTVRPMTPVQSFMREGLRQGEYWDARSDEALEAGEAVEVVGIENMLLRVRRQNRSQKSEDSHSGF